MRNKRNRKLMSILLTLSLLVAMLVPMVGPASAAVTYSMTSVNKIGVGNNQKLGSLVVTMDGASAKNMAVGDAVYLDVPSTPTGFGINALPYTYTDSNGNTNTLDISAYNGTTGGTGSDGNFSYEFKTTQVSTTEIRLTYIGNAGGLNDLHMSDNLVINVPLDLSVPSGVSGAVTLTAVAKSSSAFSSGSLTVANVGTGTLTLAAETVPTIDGSTNVTTGVVDVKEDIVGAMTGPNKALSMTLPPGFSWNTAKTNVVWGDTSLAINNATSPTSSTTPYLYIGNNNGRELDLYMGGNTKTSSPTFLKITGTLTVDESVAKTGDITVSIGGDSTSNVSDLVIGSYGTFGMATKAFSSTSIIAGQAGQKIGELEIDEAAPGSFVPGRTVTLTLPSNVEWASSAPSIDTTNSQNNGDLSVNSAQNSGALATCEGSSANVLKITMGGQTNTNPAKLVIKNLEVTPALDYSGDLAVTLGGSQGLTGTVTLATVSAPVTATAATTPNVIVGQSAQSLGDITLTEAGTGYISSTITYSKPPVQTASPGYTTDNATISGETMLTVQAPSGVTFTSTPTVKVTSGDLQIDNVSTDTDTNNKGLIYIKIKSSSSQASTIAISGIQVNVDRTVPAGDVNFTIKGDAINQTYTLNTNNSNIDTTDSNSLFPGHNNSVAVKAGTVITAPENNNQQTAVFTIGSTDFTLNGAKTTMDAAPYIKNDRTYLPIRFVAEAVGVNDSNIIWNSDDQSVTLIKAGTVVKLTVGSTTMTINGTPVTMDVAPEIVDPGRTMLPVRWVGQALGCTVNWDAATQTVTVN